MSLMQIKIGHVSDEKIAVLPDDAWRRLREAFGDHFTEKEKDGTKHRGTAWSHDQIADQDEAQLLSSCGISFEVKRFRGNTRPDDFRAAAGAPQGGPVHFHLPNFSLFSVTEVKLLEDCCTDQLQGELSEGGWRIIAVCPPLNARRPDYILGRCGDSTRERS